MLRVIFTDLKHLDVALEVNKRAMQCERKSIQVDKKDLVLLWTYIVVHELLSVGSAAILNDISCSKIYTLAV